MSNGLRALLVVASSSVLGAIYYQYLQAEPFPPDAVRFVPIVWLAGALLGCALAVRGLVNGGNRVAAGLALLLVVPGAVLALVFTLAALLGD